MEQAQELQQPKLCTQCHVPLDDLVIKCCEHECARCKKVICETCGVYYSEPNIIVCKECSNYHTKDGRSLEE